MDEAWKEDPAFPDPEGNHEGISYREYFATRAPSEVPLWFYKRVLSPDKPLDTSRVTTKEHAKVIGYWPWFWADMVIEHRQGGFWRGKW